MAAVSVVGERGLQRRLLRESSAARAAIRRAALLGLASAAAIVAQAALLAHLIAATAFGHASLGALSDELIALAAVVAARALLAGAFESSGRIAAAEAMSQLRARLARTLLIEDPARALEDAAEGSASGELAGAAVAGVDALLPLFAGYLPQIVLAAAVPALALAYLAAVDALAAVLLLLSIPLLIAFMVLIGKRAGAAARSRMRALAILSGHFVDVVSGLSTLRVFRRAQAQTIARVGERLRAETMGTLRIAFLSALVLELGAMIAMALVAATIGVQLDGGALKLQAGLVVLLLAPEIYGALRGVGQRYHAGADGLAAAERIFRALDSGEGQGPAATGRPIE